MAVKGYFLYLKIPGLETHHQIQFSVISGHTLGEGISYSSAEVRSAYSTAPSRKMDSSFFMQNPKFVLIKCQKWKITLYEKESLF